VPVVITETSARDSEEARSGWLHSSLAMVKQLRSEGVPVLGYTWFPLFTMVDWRYRWERGPVEKYMIDLGMYQLDQHANGSGSRWKAYPLAQDFRNYINNPEQAIGHLAIG
jgi:beta-glucosidase